MVLAVLGASHFNMARQTGRHLNKTIYEPSHTLTKKRPGPSELTCIICCHRWSSYCLPPASVRNDSMIWCFFFFVSTVWGGIGYLCERARHNVYAVLRSVGSVWITSTAHACNFMLGVSNSDLGSIVFWRVVVVRCRRKKWVSRIHQHFAPIVCDGLRNKHVCDYVGQSSDDGCVSRCCGVLTKQPSPIYCHRHHHHQRTKPNRTNKLSTPLFARPQETVACSNKCATRCDFFRPFTFD